MSGPIERYLGELARALPRLLPTRRRILAELEDHLREAARASSEEEAIRRLGRPTEIARSFSGRWAVLVAAAAVLAVLAFPVLSYPVVENSLPPAPWPTADAIPSHLEWKRDVIAALFLAALVVCAVALVLRRAFVIVLALAPVAAMSILGLVLSVEWQAAVPGTPTWLLAVPALQLALAVSAGVLAARAALLRARSPS